MLIVIDNFYLGGIATSLYNFLQEISRRPIDCDLLVFDPSSIKRERIPKNIRILTPDKHLLILGNYLRDIFARSKRMGLLRVFYTSLSQLLSGDQARSLLFRFVRTRGDYDLAIAYTYDYGWHKLTPGCRQYLADKVRAKTKAVYIHADISKDGSFDRRLEACYNTIDRILCVSEGCKNIFLQRFPSLREKTAVLENFTDVDRILHMMAPAVRYQEKTVFITASRLVEQKAYFRALHAFYRIKEVIPDGYKWVIIGDGSQRAAIQKKIREYRLEKIVELIGQKDNPYPYFPNASCYLLLSYHEAAPMVINECGVIGLPVISTETCSAKELVEERGRGWVIKNNEDAIYEAVLAFLEGRVALSQMTSDLKCNAQAETELQALLESL